MAYNSAGPGPASEPIFGKIFSKLYIFEQGIFCVNYLPARNPCQLSILKYLFPFPPNFYRTYAEEGTAKTTNCSKCESTGFAHGRCYMALRGTFHRGRNTCWI